MFPDSPFMIAAPIPGSKCLDSPLTIPFYECGVQLTDMVYLQRKYLFRTPVS